MATMKNAPPLSSLPPLASDPHTGAIRISLTNQRGQRYRYRAQAVSLSMKKGVLQVIENEQGCFLWFDQCNLEIREGVQNLLFHLKTGAASSLPGAGLVILADLTPSATKAMAQRQKRSRPASAAKLAS